MLLSVSYSSNSLSPQVQLVQNVIDGVKFLITVEQELEKKGSIADHIKNAKAYKFIKPPADPPEDKKVIAF